MTAGVEVYEPSRLAVLLEGWGVRMVKPEDITQNVPAFFSAYPDLVGDRTSMERVPNGELYYRGWWKPLVPRSQARVS